MNDKLLVVGASGFIGQSLWRKLPSRSRLGTFYRHPMANLVHLDLRDDQQTWKLIHDATPPIVFQSAAVPNVEWCEENRDACWETNVAGTNNLVRAVRDVGAKLVFFSTDYIFDGEGGPYREDDVPNPVNVYGESKLAAEQVIQETLKDYLIVRTTVVYGWEQRGKNFVMALIDRLSQGQQMKVPMDQIGSPTYADNMLEAVLELVRGDHRGIFHVAGAELMDRYTFAQIAADVFDLDEDLLIPVTTDELGQKARRPLRAGMRIDKVQSLLQTELLLPRQGLELMRERGNPFRNA